MSAAVVQLGIYADSPQDLGKLLDRVWPKKSFGPHERVVIKPNLVGWDDPFPLAPYGVFTTTRLVEDLLIWLKERGARRLTIAEGSVCFGPRDKGTPKLFERLGYHKLKQRYGLELVDLNQGPFARRELAGIGVRVSRAALDAQVLINLPVLKTHNQARLSCGLKNLKGCLAQRSRQRMHGKGQEHKSLHEMLAGLDQLLRPDLTIVDGIYALERGPFALGRARRSNILLAGRDALAVDWVAARSLGLDPEQVPHLALCAERRGRPEEPRVCGPDLTDLVCRVDWDFPWLKDPQAAGPLHWRDRLKGLSLPKYDGTLCTGCSVLYNPLVLMLDRSWPKGPEGLERPSLQVLTGKRMSPCPGFDQTLLVGDCMVKKNAGHRDGGQLLELAGCPPSLEQLESTLRQLDLPARGQVVSDYRMKHAQRYRGDPEFQAKHFFFDPAQQPDWL